MHENFNLLSNDSNNLNKECINIKISIIMMKVAGTSHCKPIKQTSNIVIIIKNMTPIRHDANKFKFIHNSTVK